MVNKKDITIIVAPKRCVDLNVRDVANRIMRLAERNSTTFQRANAKQSERMQAIEALKLVISEKEVTLARLQRELEVKKMERDYRYLFCCCGIRTRIGGRASVYIDPCF